ncbi:unnamed protein product, partial [Tetraodon nigroviridis]
MGDFASPAAGANGGICINSGMNPSAGGCESRYQQAHAKQLDMERRETVSLYQRTLEQRAKKAAGGGGKQPQSKQPEPDSASSAEQRSSTLIAVRTRASR